MFRWRWLATFAIVAPMALVAYLGHSSVYLFPEGAALAFGVLSLELVGWTNSPVQLFLLPSAAAFLGVESVRVGVPELLAVALLLVGILGTLLLLRSGLAPTISAGVLPVVFHLTSFIFVGSVFVVAALLALGAWALSKVHRSAREAPSPAASSSQSAVRQFRTIAFGAISFVWFVVALHHLPQSALAPPVLVSLFEWTLSSSKKTFRRGVRRWIAVVGSAIVGEVAHQSFNEFLAAIVAIAVVLILLGVLGDPHPPALAISLLPLIAGSISAFDFVLGVLVTFTILIAVFSWLPNGIKVGRHTFGTLVNARS